MLKKSKKINYTISKAYRFIILLNILEKVFKSVLTQQINIITEQHILFL